MKQLFQKGNTNGYKHGYYGTPTYQSWKAMKRRIKDPNDAHIYRDRGIVICERWNSFENFLADMGERPEGTTLDRINNDGNYEPSNCRWASSSQQNKNQKRSVLLTAFGKTQNLVDWAREYGLPKETLWKRVRKDGMPLEKALALPFRRYKLTNVQAV